MAVCCEKGGETAPSFCGGRFHNRDHVTNFGAGAAGSILNAGKKRGDRISCHLAAPQKPRQQPLSGLWSFRGRLKCFSPAARGLKKNQDLSKERHLSGEIDAMATSENLRSGPGLSCSPPPESLLKNAEMRKWLMWGGKVFLRSLRARRSGVGTWSRKQGWSACSRRRGPASALARQLGRQMDGIAPMSGPAGANWGYLWGYIGYWC